MTETLSASSARLSFTSFYLCVEFGEAGRRGYDAYFNANLTVVLSPEFAVMLDWVLTDAVEGLKAQTGRPQPTRTENENPFIIPAEVARTESDIDQTRAAIEALLLPDRSNQWHFRSRERPEIEARPGSAKVVVDAASAQIDQSGVQLTLGYLGGKGALRDGNTVVLSPELTGQLRTVLREVLIAFEAQCGAIRREEWPPAMTPDKLKLFQAAYVSPSSRSRRFRPA